MVMNGFPKKVETLSDKLMYQMGDEELDKDNMVLHEKDVKEFIKRVIKDCQPYLESGCPIPIAFIMKERAGDALVGVDE